MIRRTIVLAAALAALLGTVADWTSISFVYGLCSYLPAIGLLAMFLPGSSDLKRKS